MKMVSVDLLVCLQESILEHSCAVNLYSFSVELLCCRRGVESL